MSLEQSVSDSKKSKYEHTFQKNWLVLMADKKLKTDTEMICALCSGYGKINTLTRGCKNY